MEIFENTTDITEISSVNPQSMSLRFGYIMV